MAVKIYILLSIWSISKK